jgi:glycyl-tRNA synthetase
MPFAAAQIGLGFRNEIAPRNGLLRVREFCMAEIEHFVDPKDKSHPKFYKVADKKVILFPQDAQLGSGRTVDITIGDAVSSGMINNQTLGYFMARTQIFLEKIGIDPSRMRFRQHLKTEMAHYAADCWDMEIQLVYGWIECVGHADRSCYDLEQHSLKTGVPLNASMRLAEPMIVDKLIAEPNKKLLGPRFKNDQKIVLSLLEALDGEDLEKFQAAIVADGKAMLQGTYEITADLVSFKQDKKTIHEVKYTPSVIEPSYGVGRILYALLEHSFYHRDGDEQRCVMSFRPCVAPIKVGIYRLLNNVAFDPVVNSIHDQLQALNLSNRVDSSSGTIGKRYARADELGVPFGVTIDFQTLLDDTVTLRERDSMVQVRVPLARLVELVQRLVAETMSWEEIKARYPIVQLAGDEEEDGEVAVDGQKKVDESKVKASTAPTVIERCMRASFSRPNPAS